MESVVVSGIVSASGVGGVKVTGDRWHLVFHFDGWLHPAMPTQKSEMRLEMAVSEDDLKGYMARIKPYDLLQVRGELAEHPNTGKPYMLIQDIVSFDVEDAELAMYAQELQQPVTVRDPHLGTFTLDRAANWFVGHPTWNQTPVRLNLSMDGCDDVTTMLTFAAELWHSQADWKAKTIECAVNDLLPLKNDTWLDDEETPLSSAQFQQRLALESITLYPDGAFEFWYDDSDLFWGHIIMVSGSLAKGPENAQLYG